MKVLSKDQISKFLAFTIGSESKIIDIPYLNSIQLDKNEGKDITHYSPKVLEIMREEIRSYMIQDGENIGVLLSGGLDSTLLLSLLKENFKNSKIFTYTLGYSLSDAHLEKARNISMYYGTIHKEIVYDLETKLFDTFEDIYKTGYSLEGEDSLIMNHILSSEVKKDCSIVFSGFGLDYVFAGMDLFRNSFMEDLYLNNLIDKAYIYNTLGGNKFYLKYVLDKIDSDLGQEFFIKYGEYYGYSLKADLEKSVIEYFFETIGTIRSDISDLKKQIYFIISTSLSNRFNPYNKPYERLGIQHFNPFGSKETISKIIALNIPDIFLYNPYTKEKKYIIREISKDIIPKELYNNLHTGTVLNYEKSFTSNVDKILDLVQKNTTFLAQYFPLEYIQNFGNIIKDAVWYENSKQIILILQLLFYVKNNEVISYEIQESALVENKILEKSI